MVSTALTDAKGDRSIVPGQQPDPDMYIHVVERRSDGIVVNGAKAHLTSVTNAHEILVFPTMALREEEGDYAICFATPADAEGITIIVGRQSCDTRKLEGCPIDVGNPEFGSLEALTIFDHVFIPNDRIFMNGETEFAGVVVERFATSHRNSYGGCKAGVGDTLIGATALWAEYSGVEKASHIKDKLIEMTHLNETLYACGIASAAEGYRTEAGNYTVNSLIANVCKQNVTRFPYEIGRLSEDIAGGLFVTAPSEKDLNNPVTGPYIEKYLKGAKGVSAETRLKLVRFLENMALGTGAVGD
jgi:4-hydroxybutyryl-CoA dehydratase/vinylacetyl-CoA-Delta-isomerase